MQNDPTPTLKGVLFDLDGTLANTYDLILTSFRYATSEVLGQTIPDNLLMAKVGIPLEKQMEDFTSDPAVQARLVEVYRAFNHANHDAMVKSYPGVTEALKSLADAGIALGVVTSKRHALAQRGLAAVGLDGLVRFVIGSDDCPAHKPLPDPVLAGCAQLGLSPEQCAYVGDSPFDIAAGNAAGCRTVAVTWGVFPTQDLATQNPWQTVDQASDMARVLLEA